MSDTSERVVFLVLMLALIPFGISVRLNDNLMIGAAVVVPVAIVCLVVGMRLDGSRRGTR